MSKGAAIFGWVKMFAPMVLAQIPATKALAPRVATILDLSEGMKDATGSEKKSKFLSLVREGAESVNDGAGKVLVDPQEAVEAASAGLETAFHAARVAAATHGAAVQ